MHVIAGLAFELTYQDVKDKNINQYAMGILRCNIFLEITVLDFSK